MHEKLLELIQYRIYHRYTTASQHKMIDLFQFYKSCQKFQELYLK